jgi:hypothetical protein
MQKCSIHRYHRPRPLTTEQHHVLPRAWQAVWQPEEYDGKKLWLPKTIPLCPTGHRSVHHILVEIMHEFEHLIGTERVYGFDLEVPLLAKAEANIKAKHGNTNEFPIACLAPRLWKSKFGLLKTLLNRKQYGQALVGNLDHSL